MARFSRASSHSRWQSSLACMIGLLWRFFDVCF
jgi:hypothetical protein